jgi:hypothetical protein
MTNLDDVLVLVRAAVCVLRCEPLVFVVVTGHDRGGICVVKRLTERAGGTVRSMVCTRGEQWFVPPVCGGVGNRWTARLRRGVRTQVQRAAVRARRRSPRRPIHSQRERALRRGSRTYGGAATARPARTFSLRAVARHSRGACRRIQPGGAVSGEDERGSAGSFVLTRASGNVRRQPPQIAHSKYVDR